MMISTCSIEIQKNLATKKEFKLYKLLIAPELAYNFWLNKIKIILKILNILFF